MIRVMTASWSLVQQYGPAGRAELIGDRRVARPSTHGAERPPDLIDEEVRLLERGEVAAPVELFEEAQVRIVRLDPAPGRSDDLAGEDRDADGYMERVGRPADALVGRSGEAVLPVDPGRRGGRRGEPVQADVVEHLVVAERVDRVAPMVGPGPVLLGDPGGLADRRVDQPVPDGLRPGGLLECVRRTPLAVEAD